MHLCDKDAGIFGLTYSLIEVKYDLVRPIQHFLDKMNGTGQLEMEVERGGGAWYLQVFLLKITRVNIDMAMLMLRISV